jgi:hypothetical protein
LNELIEKETNETMKEYLNIHLNKHKHNNILYTNITFVNKTTNLKEVEEIYSVHLTNCVTAIEIIDVIIKSLLNNQSEIPLVLKYICKIIELVYIHKKRMQRNIILLKQLQYFYLIW